MSRRETHKNRKDDKPMKKLVSLLLALLLCASMLAASLLAVGNAAEPDPDPNPAVSGEPDPVHSAPPREDTENKA